VDRINQRIAMARDLWEIAGCKDWARASAE
jgi:hypothetical protein